MLQLGRATTVRVGDRDYTFGRLELHVLKDFAAWVREQEGDPFAVVDRYLAHLDPKAFREELTEAKEIRDQLKSFSLSSPLARRYLATADGIARLAQLMLRASGRHPDISEDEAFAVVVVLPEGKLDEILANAAGKVPGKKEPAPEFP